MPGEGETVLQIIPKGDAELAAGFLQARKGIATLSTEFTASPPTDLALFDEVADVALTVVGVQGYFGPFKHEQEL